MKGARPLTTSEIRKTLRACRDTRERSMILLGINLGLRVGELLSLRWQDVWQNNQVPPLLYLRRSETKNNKARAIPINKNAKKAILLMYKESLRKSKSVAPENHLFSGRNQGHLNPRHVNRLLYQIFNRAGLIGRLSSHTLRKTFGTTLSENNVSLPAIQELLGHADISTTRKYIGVGLEKLKQAVLTLEQVY